MSNDKLTQYVVFKIGKETYALNVGYIVRIETNRSIRPVPNAPKEVKGIITVADEVVPVVDLRIKFNIESDKIDAEPFIIIIKLRDYIVGVVVDEVDEVIDIEGEISLGNVGETIGGASEYIQGIYKRERKAEKEDESGSKKSDAVVDLLIILDLNKLLGFENLEEIVKSVE